jgi:hypothetical protein
VALAAGLCPPGLRGDDFQVNAYTTGQQAGPRVSTAADGRFVVTWASEGSYGSDPGLSAQARIFAADGTPEGLEFQLNTYTTAGQYLSEVAAAPDGRFVAVWFGDQIGVRGQRFAADGTPLGAEMPIAAGGDPRVGIDASGRFVVAHGAGSGVDLFARRFGFDGTPLGGQFQVNSYTTGEQRQASLAMAPAGDFVVTWWSEGSFGDDPSVSVQARRFAADGSPAGPEFQVNTHTTGGQWGPEVGMDAASGDFVVVWNTQHLLQETEIAAQRYRGDGTLLGGEMLVNTDTTGEQFQADVAVAPGGEFLVTWRDKPSGLPSDCTTCRIVARRYRADGTPYAPEFRVNSYSTTDFRALGGVSVDASGNFVVTWTSVGSPGDDQDTSSIQGARQVSELSITNDDGVATAVPGGSVTYTIRAAHVTGLQAGVSARVVDAFPSSLSCSWTCRGSVGASCTAGPVAGHIDDPVALPVGGAVTYTAVCAIDPTATGSVVNTASILGPPGLFDPTPADDAATDVDGLQGLLIDDVAVLEGDAGATTASFTVTLASPLPTPVSVDFGSFDGTATTAGSDYLPVSGTLLFAPGETAKPVTVSVLGDTLFEADEGFFVSLGNAVGSVIVDGLGQGTILNDDAALPSGSRDELVPGSAETTSLETQPGPVPIAREWRVLQRARASYEAIVDGVTGDLGPDGPALDRLASDGTVLQSAVGAGVGSSRSLRFENRGGAVSDERIRVQSRGCITDCDAADRFRIRLHETTLFGPRFNNAGSQVTVVIVQNTSEDAVSGHLDFQDASGALLHAEPFTLQPRQALVLNPLAPPIPAIQGQAGTMSLSHDGRHGALVGKATALQPSTGFTFDTPLMPRRR